jgi:hypothetical protein
MKNILFKIAIFLGGPILIIKGASAQSSQPLPEFNRLRIDDNVEVELVIADRYSLYSDGSAGVEGKVENGQLTLSRKGAGSNKVKIFTKGLNEIRMDGAAKLTSTDTIAAERLAINLDGATKAVLLVNCKNLKIDLDGGSGLEIKGSSTQAMMNVDGATRLRATGLIVDMITVQADGAASAHVNATQTLNARADGASGVKYVGEPQNKNFSIDGLATVKALDGGEVYDNKTPKLNEEANRADGDTTRIKMGKRKLMIIKDKDENGKSYGEEGEDNEERRRRMKRVWGGLELGLLGFTTADGNFNMPAAYKYLNTKMGESWFIALNTPDLDGHIIKNKLAITTGLGVSWSNIHFDGNDVLTPNADSMSATPSPAGVNLSKNKLHTFDITAPLLIKFAPGKRRKAKGGFHFATGAIFHYVANARVVTETSSGGYDQRTELNDNFNINPLRVDATVRVGYDRIKLFANYSLTPYFNASKSPDVRLFTAGLTLIGF